MTAGIQRSEVIGSAEAPASKSYTHRAVVCAGMAMGESIITNPLASDDTEATTTVMEKLGTGIRKGNGWRITGSGFRKPGEKLFCRESGTTLRIMTAVCSLVKGECILTGNERLMERPIQPLLNAMKQLGAKCCLKRNRVIVNNNFAGGHAELPGNVSSQFLSALLLISPFAGARIRVTSELESEPYVRMTMDMQKQFGVDVSVNEREFFIEKQDYTPARISVESDWSSAAFLLAAGAVAGRVKISNVNPDSIQADKNIVRIMQQMGAKIKTGKNYVIAEKSALNAVDIDVRDCPDLFPVVCVLCSLAKGASSISGIERLAIMESDLSAAVKEGLKILGVKVTSGNNEVVIKGSVPRGAKISPHNDHRIAMAFAVLGLAAEGKTLIENPECVKKSFPGFWEVLSSMGADVNGYDNKI